MPKPILVLFFSFVFFSSSYFIWYCLTISKFYIGDMYCDGTGCAVNYKAAMDLYKRSVAQGNAHGQTRLGMQLSCSISLSPLVSLLSSRCVVNLISPQGNMYRYGMGCTVNYGKALNLYRMAVEHQNANALNNLGILWKEEP